MGDYLFPGLGNGGYDARDYTLKLRYPTAPAEQVQGTVVMDALATHDLSSFNLDFAGDAVTAVRVNGQPAKFTWQQQDEELVITPARSLRRGCSFEAVPDEATGNGRARRDAMHEIQHAGLVDPAAATGADWYRTAGHWSDATIDKRIDGPMTTPAVAAATRSIRALDEPTAREASDHLPVMLEVDLSILAAT